MNPETSGKVWFVPRGMSTIAFDVTNPVQPILRTWSPASRAISTKSGKVELVDHFPHPVHPVHASKALHFAGTQTVRAKRDPASLLSFLDQVLANFTGCNLFLEDLDQNNLTVSIRAAVLPSFDALELFRCGKQSAHQPVDVVFW